MARPVKQGLDYFPFDCDFFEDERIMAIAGEFGSTGEIVAVRLLTMIYHKGYWMQWSKLLKMKLMRCVDGLTVELLDTIVERLAEFDFFDAETFHKSSVLTSRDIQERYAEATRRRRNTPADRPWWLLARPASQEAPRVIVDNNPANENKENKTEIKQNLTGERVTASALMPAPAQAPTPAPAPTPARKRDFVEETIAAQPVERLSAILADLGIDLYTFRALARAEYNLWMVTGKRHRDLSDAVSHLFSAVGIRARRGEGRSVAARRDGAAAYTDSDMRAARERQEADRRRAEQKQRQTARTEQCVSWAEYCRMRGLNTAGSAAQAIVNNL